MRTPAPIARTLLLAVALLTSTVPALAADDALFVRLTTPGREFYLQEVFDFTLSVHSRGLNMGREISLVNEEVPGLRFLPYQDLGSRREVIDGRLFDVHRFLGRAQAVATGTSALRPSVRVSVVVPPRGRGGGSADDPASGRAEVRLVDLRPAPAKVEIQPLPEAGKPEGFTGAVGSFTFSAAVTPAAAVEGEPVTLTMDIRGSGNIDSVAAPPVRAGDSFKAYEPKLLKKEISEDRSRGRMVFEQILVPRSTTSTSLPAVVFSYFDPSAKAYRKLSGGPFRLTVAPSARPGAKIVEAPPSGQAAKKLTLRSDIAPLKPEPRDWSRRPAWSRRVPLWFVALQIVPLGVVVALFFAARRRDELARDVVKARRQLAPDAARSGIGAAEKALREGDPAAFQEALWQALCRYFGHCLNLLPGEISGEAVIARLSQAGIAPRDAARLGEIFRLSEQARFAPRSRTSGPLSEEERQRLSALLEEFNGLMQACDRITQ